MQKTTETKDFSQFINYLAYAVFSPRHKIGLRDSIDVNGRTIQIDSRDFGETYKFQADFQGAKGKVVYSQIQTRSFDDEPFDSEDYTLNMLKKIEERISTIFPNIRSFGVNKRNLSIESAFKTLQDSIQ